MTLCERCHTVIEAHIQAVTNIRPKGKLRGLRNYTHKVLARYGVSRPGAAQSSRKVLYDLERAVSEFKTLRAGGAVTPREGREPRKAKVRPQSLFMRAVVNARDDGPVCDSRPNGRHLWICELECGHINVRRKRDAPSRMTCQACEG